MAQGASVLVGRTLIAPEQPVIIEGWEAKEIKKRWGQIYPTIYCIQTWGYMYNMYIYVYIYTYQYQYHISGQIYKWIAILMEFPSSNSSDTFAVLASVPVTLTFASVCLFAASQWYVSLYPLWMWPDVHFEQPAKTLPNIFSRNTWAMGHAPSHKWRWNMLWIDITGVIYGWNSPAYNWEQGPSL